MCCTARLVFALAVVLSGCTAVQTTEQDNGAADPPGNETKASAPADPGPTTSDSPTTHGPAAPWKPPPFLLATPSFQDCATSYIPLDTSKDRVEDQVPDAFVIPPTVPGTPTATLRHITWDCEALVLDNETVVKPAQFSVLTVSIDYAGNNSGAAGSAVHQGFILVGWTTNATIQEIYAFYGLNLTLIDDIEVVGDDPAATALVEAGDELVSATETLDVPPSEREMHFEWRLHWSHVEAFPYLQVGPERKVDFIHTLSNYTATDPLVRQFLLPGTAYTLTDYERYAGDSPMIHGEYRP